MKNGYVYRKIVRQHHRSVFRRRLLAALVLLLVIISAAGVLYYDLYRSNSSGQNPVSEVEQQVISDNLQTFSSPYFKFTDNGKWVLKEDESSDDKYVYYRYRGLNIEHQLVIYVNQVPISLYLAVNRALPVRIVSSNSFDVTNVSGPCIRQYSSGELHKIKIVTIEGAGMLCDPDTPLYTVVLSEIDGDYRLSMRRSSGAPVQFVITYRDYRLEPETLVIKRIAASFQAL